MRTLEELFRAALAARENAYAPYSGFKVGAAARLHDDTVIGACNVENVSYGATVCAERNVVAAAIARTGTAEIDDLVVVAGGKELVVPCALCLQVLREFCPPELHIHLADLEGIKRTVTLGELLPVPFSSF